MNRESEIVIAGGGPVGLAAAISLARDGREVTVIERAPEPILARPAFDGREIALTYHASNWLKSVGAWAHLPAHAISPLQTARIESGHTPRKGRALLFRAPQDGPDALGHLVANHLIRTALFAVAKVEPRVRIVCGLGIAEAATSRQQARVTLENGVRYDSSLLIGADGRFSRLRQMMGIGAIVHDFHASILVCRLRHPTPHEATALQWFDEGQTIALLPVAADDRPGSVSSLVLTLPADEIEALRAMDEVSFNADITARTQERFGPMTLESARCVYPLKAVYAHRFQTTRFALLGDAAVGMHPITAHGFNLGLRGQESLARAIAEGEGDAGDPAALRTFQRRHRLATAPLFAATNGIGVIYSHDALPMLALRRAGLGIADQLAPFKRFVTGVLMDRNSPA